MKLKVFNKLCIRGFFLEKIKKVLLKNKIEFFENFNLSVLSSIKIGEVAKIVIFPKTIKQLKFIILWLIKKNVYFKIIGNASNILFVSTINYPLIVTSKMIDEIEICDNEVNVSSGVLLTKLSDILRKNELSGIEGLSGIPATIGGAIINGAGAFGYNIYDKLISILVVCDGKIKTINRNEINFRHHFSNLHGVFILSAKFLFEKKNEYDIIKAINKFSYLRSKTQPAGLSLGSVYQKINDKSAAFYIERSGLKNKKFGGIIISNKHANFFINEGSATAVDFLRLMAFVEASVESHFGLNLLVEIEKVGDKNETDCRLSHSFK